MRYHPLSAGVNTIPVDVAITAAMDRGVIIRVRHDKYTLEAVQYHPEKVLSEAGDSLFRNILSQMWCLGELPERGVLHPFPLELAKSRVSRNCNSEGRQARQSDASHLATFLALHMALLMESVIDKLKAKSKATALMAEIKRAYPSKGPIALAANAAQQMLTYALAGMSVISIPTEPA